MESANPVPVPVLEVVTFHANEKCTEDLALFKEVRDIVAATTNVKAMYWGRSIEFPSLFIWLLLWDSFAQSTARAETPSHAEMTRKLDALVDDPSRKRVMHMNFAQLEFDPLACLEAPVTEFDMAELEDTQIVAQWNRVGLSVMANIRAAQPEGYLSMARGVSVEDLKNIVYLSGWRSVEDHMRLGTLESHQKIVKEAEELFSYFRDLQIHHVHFERHT